mmetsp:Transcript_9377/g.16967  ORF Transcript_9377/g.16967 Transcript_9377/m.16967 type:complete len:312 (-) Transcript_9377:1069-2004(-)
MPRPQRPGQRPSWQSMQRKAQPSHRDLPPWNPLLLPEDAGRHETHLALMKEARHLRWSPLQKPGLSHAPDSVPYKKVWNQDWQSCSPLRLLAEDSYLRTDPLMCIHYSFAQNHHQHRRPQAPAPHAVPPSAAALEVCTPPLPQEQLVEPHLHLRSAHAKQQPQVVLVGPRHHLHQVHVQLMPLASQTQIPMEPLLAAPHLHPLHLLQGVHPALVSDEVLPSQLQPPLLDPPHVWAPLRHTLVSAVVQVRAEAGQQLPPRCESPLLDLPLGHLGAEIPLGSWGLGVPLRLPVACMPCYERHAQVGHLEASRV